MMASSSRATRAPDGEVSATSAYSYDAVSRMTGLNDDLAGAAADRTTTFGYNAVGQIRSRTLSNNAYAWTDAANINRNYSVNSLNQYLTSGSVTLSYDARGNLTNSGSATYAYNSENMLVGASGSHNVALSYDPLGRLFRIAGSTATRLGYDGPRLIAEYNDSNGLWIRRVSEATECANISLSTGLRINEPKTPAAKAGGSSAVRYIN